MSFDLTLRGKECFFSSFYVTTVEKFIWVVLCFFEVVGNLMMMHGQVSNNGVVMGFDGFLANWVSRLYLYLLRVLRFRNFVQ
jgi:hypothetical protein